MSSVLKCWQKFSSPAGESNGKIYLRMAHGSQIGQRVFRVQDDHDQRQDREPEPEGTGGQGIKRLAESPSDNCENSHFFSLFPFLFFFKCSAGNSGRPDRNASRMAFRILASVVRFAFDR